MSVCSSEILLSSCCRKSTCSMLSSLFGRCQPPVGRRLKTEANTTNKFESNRWQKDSKKERQDARTAHRKPQWIPRVPDDAFVRDGA
eukprot:766628-Hanusia_phi.AAC.1